MPRLVLSLTRVTGYFAQNRIVYSLISVVFNWTPYVKFSIQKVITWSV